MNKKKKNNDTLYASALYTKHSELYNTDYEDSKEIVNSVLDSIKQLLKECSALSIPEFGKFFNHERKPYQMTNNFPGSEGKRMIVPTKHLVRFTASPKFNESSDEYFEKKQEAKDGEE